MIFITLSQAKKWDDVYINKLIAKGDIDKVILHYQEAYNSVNRNPQDAFKIAELYVRKKDYSSAMKWYDKESQMIYSSKVNLFNYANTNRLMGEYQKALDGYLMYAANTGDLAKISELASLCEKILKLSAQSANYKLESYTYNTAEDETNVALLRTNAVYNTVSKPNNDEKQTYSINQVVRDFQNFAEPVKAYQNNIPKIIITSLSYTKDGNTVVFSAKDAKTSGKKNTKNNERIYIADNLGGNFLNPKQLSFNTEGFSFKNPSFNDDGSVIYFSSNQTGSLGGFDIWKTKLEKGKWSIPVNLGILVNTKSDEINPFIVQDEKENKLYFSSDRDGGFGGFDIYLTKNAFNVWQDVELQSAPINSSGNDISIVYDDEVKTGYFSSDRNGGKGGFDLYRFTPFNLKIIVNTFDSTTNTLLDYVYVQLNENNSRVFEGMTNEKGRADFQVGRDRTFRINVSKDNYRPVMVNATTTGKPNFDSVVVNVSLMKDEQFNVLKGATNAITLENFVIFTGHVIDAATNLPNVNIKMRMVNYATQKLRDIDLDKDGKFEIKLFQNNNYKVIFENQSAKITDELTTYGLDKNDVKVRDYLLSASKFKLTENKVYKSGNLPSNIKISSTTVANAKTTSTTVNQSITKSKVDSLLKAISNDNQQMQTTKKTVATPVKTKTAVSKTAILKNNTVISNETITASAKPAEVQQTVPKTAEKPKEIVKTTVKEDVIKQTTAVTSEKPVITQSNQKTKVVTENNEVTTVNKITEVATTTEVSPKATEITEVIAQSAKNSIVVSPDKTIEKTIAETDVLKKEKEKETQLIIVGSGNTAETPKAATPKKENETTIMAADIVTKNKKKKIKIIDNEFEDIKPEAVNSDTLKKEVDIEITEVPKEMITDKVTEKVVEAPVKNEPEVKTIKEIPKEKPAVTIPEKPVKKETVISTPVKIETVAATVKAEELPELYFKIQLASYEENNLQFPEFDNYGKVEMVKAYDRYIYRLGNFTDLERAKQILDQVRTQGYFVAFILQYNKDKVTGIVK